MATPTFAFIKLGASLTSSPVTVTVSPRRCKCSTICSLCAGKTRANTTCWRDSASLYDPIERGEREHSRYMTQSSEGREKSPVIQANRARGERTFPLHEPIERGETEHSRYTSQSSARTQPAGGKAPRPTSPGAPPGRRWRPNYGGRRPSQQSRRRRPWSAGQGYRRTWRWPAR
eukprot:1192648-Prorocentrum_minimum.AAC.1